MALQSTNSLGIIIPMYNEEKGAARCIESVISVIKTQKLPIKLLVVDDGSTDTTKTILEEQNKKYASYLSIISYALNKGYGGALSEGIKHALNRGFTYALFMDSDLTNDPSFIPSFIREIPHGYDCVKASRYISGGKIIGVPYKRVLISQVGNFIASCLFHVGIHDCTNGFRMVRLEKLKHIKYTETNFSIILEELYLLKRQHATFKEIPTTLTTRKTSSSHFFYRPAIFFDYLKYAIKAAMLV